MSGGGLAVGGGIIGVIALLSIVSLRQAGPAAGTDTAALTAVGQMLVDVRDHAVDAAGRQSRRAGGRDDHQPGAGGETATDRAEDAGVEPVHRIHSGQDTRRHAVGLLGPNMVNAFVKKWSACDFV